MLCKTIFCFKFFIAFSFLYESRVAESNGYVNLHCKDDQNAPVDWWFIYKPALDVATPYLERGYNFSFITSSHMGRWLSSDKKITESSMLQNTLIPIYTSVYLEHLAFATYGEKHSSFLSDGSTGQGVLMADGYGGVFVSHTVPDFPNLMEHRPVFPEKQVLYGHLFMCLSVDMGTINDIANVLRHSYPNFTVIHVPKKLEKQLKDWKHLHVDSKYNKWPLSWDFHTRYRSMRAQMSVRQPKQLICLYRDFAKEKQIILDVYGRDKLTPICYNSYGVRCIKKISLKYPEDVYYVRQISDKALFAVSTAAHWQRKGTGGIQYWTCINSLEVEDRSGKSGQMFCFDNYDVWSSFDNLKVSEPKCEAD